MKKIAIIGASYLQEPLIQKAKRRGIETHVFAWAKGDVGEFSADFFYPISIIEKEQILAKCEAIGIDGICTIASDLAVVTVNYVATKMGLIGNSLECTELSTNKNRMRECFYTNKDASPMSFLVDSIDDIKNLEIDYPVIVKPTDRSGSRGITKVLRKEDLDFAIKVATDQSFEKKALIEEFAIGQEYSVECISWEGKHEFLALTKKYTTGAPHFIEIGHYEPADVSERLLQHIRDIVFHALNSLGIRYGASHSEIKISRNGEIKIIEIGGRMGGDFIGSTLVELSTGYDFLSGVLDVALGKKPNIVRGNGRFAAIHFVFSEKDIECLNELKHNDPEILIDEEVHKILNETVVDSSSRYGYFIFASSDRDVVKKYLPDSGVE